MDCIKGDFKRGGGGESQWGMRSGASCRIPHRAGCGSITEPFRYGLNAKVCVLGVFIPLTIKIRQEQVII